MPGRCAMMWVQKTDGTIIIVYIYWMVCLNFARTYAFTRLPSCALIYSSFFIVYIPEIRTGHLKRCVACHFVNDSNPPVVYIPEIRTGHLKRCVACHFVNDSNPPVALYWYACFLKPCFEEGLILIKGQELSYQWSVIIIAPPPTVRC